MSTQPKENKMGYMPENKLLLSMSIPMMLSMLVQAFYNIIDALFVASISDTKFELEAVNLAFPAQNLMIAVSVGIGVGINALISRNLGFGNHKKANKIAGQGMFLAFVSYLLFAVVGTALVRPYFELMTADMVTENPLKAQAVVDFGVQYLSICFLASFGLFIQVAHEKFMQSTGKTMLSMTTQIVGAITNIILDPILIYGWFGLPALGISGAAYATVIGQIISAIVGIILQKNKNTELSFTFEDMKPDLKTIKEIFKIGLPSILMNSIGSFMTATFNKIIIPLDTANAANVFGIYFKLQSFVFMPVFGFNNGMISIVSYNYGASNKKRVVRTIKLGFIYAVSMMLLGFAIFQIFPDTLLSMFGLDVGAITKVGVPALRTISVSFIFAGFSIICAAVFQAFGYGIFAMLVSIGRQLVTLLPVAFLLAQTGELNNVWWAFPISEIVCVLLSLIFYAFIYKNKISKIHNSSIDQIT